jgi:hypothetical protein
VQQHLCRDCHTSLGEVRSTKYYIQNSNKSSQAACGLRTQCSLPPQRVRLLRAVSINHRRHSQRSPLAQCPTPLLCCLARQFSAASCSADNELELPHRTALCCPLRPHPVLPAILPLLEPRRANCIVADPDVQTIRDPNLPLSPQFLATCGCVDDY